MINVNLLGSKPKVKGVADKGDALKTAGFIIVLFVAVGLAFVGGIRTYQWIEAGKEKPLPKNVVSSDPSLQTKKVVTEDFSANTLTVKTPIEEPLVGYKSMNALEKINYEYAYGYKLLSELVRFIPKHVDFSLMQVDSFTTLTGQGAIDVHIPGLGEEHNSRNDINAMLEEFKESAYWQIKPKPATIIRRQTDFYTFNFRVDYTVPVEVLQEVVLTDDDIPQQSQLQRIKKEILSVAKMTDLTNGSKMNRVKANTAGKYKDFYYTLEGDASFSSVMKFMESIYNKRKPISFEQIKLEAKEEKLQFYFLIKVTVL